MAWFILVFFLTISSVYGQGHGGGHAPDNSVPDANEVDTAIIDLELHYNDKLCLEILLVDCSKHVTVGDEQVCGSNYVTYDNHCKFTHAVCEYLHADTQLHLLSHGACPITTAPPTTKAPAATTAAPMTTTVAGPIVTSSGVVMTTMAPATTTTTMPTTTTTIATTPDPINGIIQSVFCQNAASISCSSGFEIICGSDGQLYPNQCELSKAKCNDPTLTVADKSTCSLPGGP